MPTAARAMVSGPAGGGLDIHPSHHSDGGIAIFPVLESGQYIGHVFSRATVRKDPASGLPDGRVRFAYFSAEQWLTDPALCCAAMAAHGAPNPLTLANILQKHTADCHVEATIPDLPSGKHADAIQRTLDKVISGQSVILDGSDCTDPEGFLAHVGAVLAVAPSDMLRTFHCTGGMLPSSNSIAIQWFRGRPDASDMLAAAQSRLMEGQFLDADLFFRLATTPALSTPIRDQVRAGNMELRRHVLHMAAFCRLESSLCDNTIRYCVHALTGEDWNRVTAGLDALVARLVCNYGPNAEASWHAPLLRGVQLLEENKCVSALRFAVGAFDTAAVDASGTERNRIVRQAAQEALNRLFASVRKCWVTKT